MTNKQNGEMGTMECTSLRDDLLDVLYGEASEAKARAVEDHCRSCAACREELSSWRRLRQDLASWDIGKGKPLGVARSWSGPFAQLAAASILLAFGCGAGFLLAETRFSRLLKADEARMEQEISTIRSEVRSAPAQDNASVLAQVDVKIRETEARQEALLHERLAGLAYRTEAQRRYDLARMSAGLSYLDGRTGQSMARTTQLMGYVLEASEKKQ